MYCEDWDGCTNHNKNHQYCRIWGCFKTGTGATESPAPSGQAEFALLSADIIKETPFRSATMVNMTDDMVKVELTMSRNDCRKLKKALNNTGI